MTRTPESTARETDPWSELETSVNLATACIHLLSEFAARQMEERCGSNLDAEAAGSAATGLSLFGHEVIVRLHRAFHASHEAAHSRR